MNKFVFFENQLSFLMHGDPDFINSSEILPYYLYTNYKIHKIFPGGAQSAYAIIVKNAAKTIDLILFMKRNSIFTMNGDNNFLDNNSNPLVQAENNGFKVLEVLFSGEASAYIWLRKTLKCNKAEIQYKFNNPYRQNDEVSFKYPITSSNSFFNSTQSEELLKREKIVRELPIRILEFIKKQSYIEYDSAVYNLSKEMKVPLGVISSHINLLIDEGLLNIIKGRLTFIRSFK